jgi:hypothetical protein
MPIEDLYQFGDDALENQFSISILPIFNVIPEQLQFRVTNVSIPERTMETYEKHWRTQKYTAPGGKITTPNEFSFTFRVDKYWGIYTMFDGWHKSIADPATGVIAPDVADGFRTEMTVNTLDSAGAPTSFGWTFTGAFPSQIGGVEFSQEGSGPLTIDVTMQFIRMVTNFEVGTFASAVQ